MVLPIRRLRRCNNASANNVSVASPEVPARMLNGGISVSAIFIAGQDSPQARLTVTSISRAVASAVVCEAGVGTRGMTGG